MAASLPKFREKRRPRTAAFSRWAAWISSQVPSREPSSTKINSYSMCAPAKIVPMVCAADSTDPASL